MTITALPTPPTRSDPINFASRADAFLAALPTFQEEANALAVAMNLNATTDTSTSSVAIGLGAKTFTVTAGKSFQPGMYLVIADTAAPSTNSMIGQVTSYSSTTLVVNITSVNGSGTKTAWSISQSVPAMSLNATDLAVTGTLTTTGNTTLGDASTDTVTVNGYVGVGGAGGSATSLWLRNSALSGTTQRGLYSNLTGTSTATTAINAVEALPATEAVAFTVANLSGFIAQNATKGAGSTITNLHGLYVADQTQGTNNYGITSLVSSGANKWNIYASGTANNFFNGDLQIGTSEKALKWLSGNGIVEAPQSLFVRSTGAFPVIVQTNGSERLRIDSTGNLGLGVTPSAWGSIFRVMQMGNAYSYVGGRTDGVRQVWLGSNSYYNGTNWIYGLSQPAAQYYQNDGNHIWNTAPSGTAGNAITFTQSLAVGNGTTLALEGATSAAGTGIAFPATQLASSNANTLDDYEEGTFTPTIVGTSTAGEGTYTSQNAQYTKIGNRVFFRLSVAWSAHTGTGNLRVSGLPFTVAATGFNEPVTTGANNLTFSGQLISYVVSGSTSINVLSFATGASEAAVAMDTAASLYISGHYHV